MSLSGVRSFRQETLHYLESVCLASVKKYQRHKFCPFLWLSEKEGNESTYSKRNEVLKNLSLFVLASLFVRTAILFPS